MSLDVPMDEKVDVPVIKFCKILIFANFHEILFIVDQHDVGNKSLHVSESQQSNRDDKSLKVKEIELCKHL